MTIVVGLTGQTGAGKTTVSDSLAQNTITVINADDVSKIVMDTNKSCLGDIVVAFGCQIIDRNGQLKRKVLADIVFHDAEKLELLNRTVYPYIVEKIKDMLDEYKAANTPLVILDAPTLYEAGCDKYCDYVIAIIAPEEMRLKRIQERDNISEEHAKARIASQHNDEFFIQHADYVIENTGDKLSLISSFNEVMRSILLSVREKYENKRAQNDN